MSSAIRVGNSDTHRDLPGMDPDEKKSQFSASRTGRSVSESAIGDNKEHDYAVPLLTPNASDSDSVTPPPAHQGESRLSRWGWRILCGAATAGSIALGAVRHSRWTNAIGSFSAGFFALLGIQSGYKDHQLHRFRQIFLTNGGQTLMYALAQVVHNVGDDETKDIVHQVMIAQLGANIAVAAVKRLWDQGSVKIESRAAAEQTGQKLTKVQFMNHNRTHMLKGGVAIGLGTAHFFIDDPVFKGLSSFFSTFYGSQVGGERLIDWIDSQIEKRDSATGTRFRKFKTALTTTSYVAQPLSLIPWNAAPGTVDRMNELFLVGLSAGFFSGASEHAEMRRIEQIPIEDLEEFTKLKAPGNPDPRAPKMERYKHVAYRVWVYAVPVVSITGLTGFAIWQEAASLTTTDSKIAMGSIWVGFVGSYAFCKWIDANWDRKKRHPIKDNAMMALWASPRILGINPILIFYAGTNVVPLDGSEIAEQSPYHRGVIFASWLAYSAAWAREEYIESSEYIGNMDVKFPQQLVVNGAMTTYLSIKG